MPKILLIHFRRPFKNYSFSLDHWCLLKTKNCCFICRGQNLTENGRDGELVGVWFLAFSVVYCYCLFENTDNCCLEFFCLEMTLEFLLKLLLMEILIEREFFRVFYVILLFLENSLNWLITQINEGIKVFGIFSSSWSPGAWKFNWKNSKIEFQLKSSTLKCEFSFMIGLKLLNW